MLVVEDTSAIATLRLATHHEHHAVEQLPAMSALAQGRPDAAAYARLLQAHLAVLGPWERCLAPWLRARRCDGWRYRPRIPALEQDLRSLGAMAAPAPAAAAGEAEDDAIRWGMLYVVEGSLLGGRVIARALRQHQPQLAGALAYFDLGSTAPQAWGPFQRGLEQALRGADARARAAAGAVAMFRRFHRHLQDLPA